MNLDEDVEDLGDDVGKMDDGVGVLANDVDQIMFPRTPRHISSSDHENTRIWLIGNTYCEEGGIEGSGDDFVETMFP